MRDSIRYPSFFFYQMRVCYIHRILVFKNNRQRNQAKQSTIDNYLLNLQNSGNNG